MTTQQNVELEAAKFLHKLIQESKDEPAKLATKLYVILQHMKSSGKENSMPYQVISRAMETVINQHGLDIEALKSSRLPIPGGSHAGDSSTSQLGGSSQAAGVVKDSKAGLAENEGPKIEQFASTRPLIGPNSSGHDYFQAPGSHRGSQSFDHESPSSLDSRSTNSQSQERRETGKKTTSKRKRGDTSVPTEPNNDNPQQLDSRNTVVNPRKGKMNKLESSGFSGKGGEQTNINMLPSGQMEQFQSLTGSMRPAIRTKQEGPQLVENQLDSTNINHLMSRALNSKYPEETKDSSDHNPLSQQQIASAHDIAGAWNQNKTGLPFEKSQVPRFSPNVVSGNAEIPMQTPSPSIGTGTFGKVHGGVPVASSSILPIEPGFSSPVQFGGTMLSARKVLEQDGGSSNMLADASKLAQAGSMLKSTAPRDTGKSPVIPPVGSGLPFGEHQLKQLRAQCLVFLAFRNGLMPKKLHLEIALGNILPKEGGNNDGSRKELVEHKVKVQSSSEPNNVPEVVMPSGRVNSAGESGTLSTGRLQDTDYLSKEAGNLKMMEDKNGPPSDHSIFAEERKHLLASRKSDVEMQTQETMASQQHHDSSGTRSGAAVRSPGDKLENGQMQVGRANQVALNKQMNPDMAGWTGAGNHDLVSRGLVPASAVQHGLASERKDSVSSQFQNLMNAGAGIQQADASLPSFSLRDRWKPVSGIDNNHHILPVNDTNLMPKHVSREQVDDDNSGPSALPPSPRYTMSEKLIMDFQKKKLLDQRSWVLKRQKAKQKIATSFHKLKENVSSSEDISTKTKSVIELKKLQLLELQRRLRSDFLNEFFKPVNTEVDRLRSLKKHKHGRRVKQLERFEQKMKEERQKRIRERQKEFFGEIEVHKERLDDVFKFRRERWKGFNKYVKEFHKRKERIHREKIDRIQREKINLLKINDVEGYLRMVQDAKSDRVKQLLKETEKYLQKLGSKLQEAKAISSRFENDMDETGTTSFVEKNEAIIDDEDESDQAKHYLESNEKYYLMAHSIKESIAEQPSSLQGGKLREYQMNGLRWLVSLYNNHLNGILADEMGLGKTVQVIALICYLMETKNDRGPFLVVVPSSVLPGWESEISFWAPSIHKIVYSGPPEERRKLFKERIVQQKFNVLLTTYEYLMNKHDRPKLSKIQWHYVIIDEGHRIKNASCKLNADLKHYQSSHRLLLTGTPLQNNLDELWALLNFLLPNIFNSSEDFSQWFNKPFQSNGDNSQDEALLSEEENLLIINRLHQVLRPFVLRRLKHKVENQLPEKIERLIRCEASAYQKLLMKRVEDNLGSINNSRARSVHNSVMELRNICNHPYISQLHADEVDTLIPKHYLPPIIRLCGKLEMLDRILPKLKATDHRVLFFSTMTRLLDVMEEYLNLKQYRYLRLDGHTSGGDRGALIDMFNKPDSPFFIFLLSIRAGGVGVNLQAADTVIIFDTDWNPQVDLQAQARAHRIGQKREVLVLRFETVQTVEEQVRASAEHKLGVANQSITAGFFDNNTSAEDRREYLESLLRESKKEEAAPVLDDDSLNDVLARSESEIDVFESIDKQRRDTEMATWRKLALAHGSNSSDDLPHLPSRLVTEDDLKEFYEAMKIYEVPKTEVVSNVGMKRKGGQLGGLDTQHYGRGKRAREVRSYEEQWTEEEFEKMCQVDGPDSPSKPKEEVTDKILPTDGSHAIVADVKKENPAPPTPAPALPLPSNVQPVQQPVQQPAQQPMQQPVQQPAQQPVQQPVRQPVQMQQSKEVTPPAKRGRGRPKRTTTEQLAGAMVPPPPSGTGRGDVGLVGGTVSSSVTITCPDALPGGISGTQHHVVGTALGSQPAAPPSVTSVSQTSTVSPSVPTAVRGQGRKTPSGTETPRRRGKKRATTSPASIDIASPAPKHTELTQDKSVNPSGNEAIVMTGTASSVPAAQVPVSVPGSAVLQGTDVMGHPPGVGTALHPPPNPLQVVTPVSQTSSPSIAIPLPPKGQGRKNQSGVGAPRRRGKRQTTLPVSAPDASAVEELKSTSLAEKKSGDLASLTTKQDSVQEPTNVTQERACHAPGVVSGSDMKSTNPLVNLAQGKPTEVLSTRHDSAEGSRDAILVESQSAAVVKDSVPESASLQPKISDLLGKETVVAPSVEDKMHPPMSTLENVAPVLIPSTDHSTTAEGVGKEKHHDVAGNVAKDPQSNPAHSFVLPSSSSTLPCPSDSLQVKRPGRKAQNRAETPRRRGRRHVPIVSPIPDAPAVQDVKSSSQSLDISAVLSGKPGIDSQQVTNLTQAQTKQATNLSATIDGSAGSSERIPAIGRIQTADVNDVARVMKEVFSVPRKTAESSRKEGKVAVPSPSNTVMEVTKNQTSEDKGSSPMATLGAAPPGFDLPVKSEKQSGKGGDANASLLDKTQAKAERKIVMGLIGKIEGAASTSYMKTTQEINDIHSQIQSPNAGRSDCVTGATVNELSSSLASPTAMEVVVGSNSAGKKTELESKETPQSRFDVSDMAADHSGATPTIAMSENPVDVVPEGMADGGSGDTMEPSVDDLKTISPHDSGSHEGPHISQKDDVGDRTNVTEIISANETEPALEELPKPSVDIPSLENPTTGSVALDTSGTANYRVVDPEKINLSSMEAEAVKCTDVLGDNSNVAAPVSQSLDHSNVMEAPRMTEIDPENETEPALKELSSFDRSLENPTTSPVSVGQSGTVTGEVDSDKYSLSSMEAVTDAAVEVPEVSLEAVADKKQAPDDKGSLPMATLETANPGFHLPVKSVKQSRNGSGANASVPDETHAKVGRKIVVGLIAIVESSSQYKEDATCTSNMKTTREINDNPLIQPPDAGPSDCVTGATFNEASSSLASPTAMEIVVISNSAGRETEPESNESQQSPRFDVSDRVADHSGATPTIAANENPADVVPDGMAGGSGNMEPSFDDQKTIYPHDSGSHEGSKISEKEDVGDPNVTSLISQTVDHSSVMEVSNMAEINSANNTEPALEELPKPSIDITSLENPTTGLVNLDASSAANFREGDPEKVNLPSIEAEAVKGTDDVGDHPNVTSPFTQSLDHSGVMEAPHMTEIDPENETEPALKESTNSSFDIRRLENPTTSPVTVGQSGTVIGEVDSSKYIAGSSGEHSVGSFVGMDETKGSANIVADDMDVEETVALPTSPSVELMIEGSSEKGRFGCSVAQGYLEMSKAELSDQMDTSDQSLPSLQNAGENVDTSVPLTESNINVETGHLVSREVDLASSVTPEEKDTEKSSEKNQISSSLRVVETKGPEAEVSQQVDVSQVSMSLPEIMSENDEKEIEGSSEKNQIAVVETKGTEAEVGQQVDVSQVSKALPEIVMSENNDPPASSIVAEKKKSEDILSSSVVLEGSLKSITAIDNRVDDSQGCEIVSEITYQNVNKSPCFAVTEDDSVAGTIEMSSLVTPEESKLKTGVASQVCDDVSECGNKDLSPCPPAQKGDNVQSLIGNSVVPEESESKVGAASLVGETVPECKNNDLPSSSPAQELESKDGIVSQVCDAVPECENKDLLPCSPGPGVDKVLSPHEMELDGSLEAPEESKPTDGAASQTLAESENKEFPPTQEGDNIVGSHEMVAGDLVAPEVSESKDEVASPVCDAILEIKDLPPCSPALEGYDVEGSNEMKLVGRSVEPEKPESKSTALEDDNVEGPNEMEVVGSSVEPEKPESKDEVASQVCDTVPECGEKDLPPCTSSAQKGDDVAGSHETGTVGSSVAPEEPLVCDAVPNCENKDLPPCSPAQESVNVAVSNEMEIIGRSVESDESEPKVSSPVCDTMPDSKNKDSPPCSSAQEVEDVKDSSEAEAKEAALGSSAKPEETRG